jgi:hypothetical protein
MSVEVDPLTSADGTPITIVPTKHGGAAKTHDDTVIELLTDMHQTLSKILTLLELEFEFQSEDLWNGEN